MQKRQVKRSLESRINSTQLWGYPSQESLAEMSGLIQDLIKSSRVNDAAIIRNPKGKTAHERYLKTIYTTKDLFAISEFVKDSQFRKNRSKKLTLSSIYMRHGIELIDNPEFAGVNSYEYACAAILARSLYCSKKLYHKSNMPFEKEDILSDAFIHSIMPYTLECKLYEKKGSENYPPELLKVAAEQLLQSIETELLLITTYYDPFCARKNPSRKLEEFVKKHISNIRKESLYLDRIARLMPEINTVVDESVLSGISKLFSNEAEVTRRIVRNETYMLYNPILKAHAHLFKLYMQDNPWAFSENTGEEISVAFRLARDTLDSMQIISHLQYHPDNNLNRNLVSITDKMCTIKNGNKLRKIIKDKGEPEVIAGLVWAHTLTGPLRKYCRAPFHGILEKLNSVGIPFHFAEKIEEALMREFTGRTIPAAKKMTISQAWNAISEDSSDYDYIQGVRKAVHHVCGIEPKPIRYKFFDRSSILEAAGISVMACVAEHDGDKGVKVIRDIQSCEEPDKTLEKLEKFYPGKDIYVGRNIGACFTYRIDGIYSLLTPRASIIDVREEVDTSIRGDEAAHILKTKTTSHEGGHGSQAGSNLMERNTVATLSLEVAKSAILLIENGTYNKQYPFDLSILKFNRSKQWRDILIDELAFYAIPALANDEDKKSYRDDGFFQTIYKKGIDPILNNNVNHDRLYSTPIEDSKTAKLYLETVDLLRRGDVKGLEQQIEKLNVHKVELGSILEHMAQAFSDVVTVEYLKSGHSRIDSDNLDKMMVAAEKSTLRRGVFSRIFLDAMRDGISDQSIRILADNGIKYKPLLMREDYEESQNVLVKLGYNSVDPFEAYEDMDDLKKRARNAGIELIDTFVPMNTAIANTGLKYEAELPIYKEVIQRLGSRYAFKAMLECESLDDVKGLIGK